MKNRSPAYVASATLRQAVLRGWRRWRASLWTPRPASGPKVIERCGTVRPAIGVRINCRAEQSAPAAATNLLSRTAMPGICAEAVAAEPARSPRRLSAFLAKRWPWPYTPGGEG